MERMAREAIAAAFPADAILGEEEGGSQDPVGRLWIVDPIDSTANFARGIQAWATLIALQIDGVGVLGVVSAPAMGERYVAIRHEGATLNGEPIHVSGVQEVADAHVLLQEMDTLFAGPYARCDARPGPGMLAHQRFRGLLGAHAGGARLGRRDASSRAWRPGISRRPRS